MSSVSERTGRIFIPLYRLSSPPRYIRIVISNNHYKRLDYNAIRSDDDVEIEKSNVLLVGPTGGLAVERITITAYDE